MKPISFTNEILNNKFISREYSKEDLEKRNSSHIHYGKPDKQSNNLLKSYLSEIAPLVENELGTPFRIVNVRTSSSKKGYFEGPTKLHLDGGPKFIRKLMIYPKPMNLDNGTFEFYDRDGKHCVINSNRPQALLFDSSTLKHRGIPPRLSPDRPMIEMTLIPNIETILDLDFAGQTARDFKLEDKLLPKYLHNYKNELIKKIEKVDFGKNVPTEQEWLRIYSKNKIKKKSLIYNLLHNQWRIRLKLFINRIMIQLFAREIVNSRNSAKNLIGGGFKFIFNSWINFDECNEKNINCLVDFSKVKTIPFLQVPFEKFILLIS